MFKHFSEDIGELGLRWNMCERYPVNLIFFMNKMTIHLDVLSIFVIDRIDDDVDAA